MHDMVHELARYAAGDEFSYTNGVANSNTKRDKLNCHYQLLISQNEISSAYNAFPAKVRALHFKACEKMRLPKQAFSHTLRLRVLDLSGCHASELPSSIYKLKLLRYLDASTLPISSLSKSLNQLVNLQTLILSNTNLNTLPTNIGCLQKLQYFDLSGCSNLCELPISFGNLSALLFLNLANCHELQTLPRSFGDLLSLQFLSLSDCHKLHTLPESCCQLCDLTYFDLSDCHSLGKLPDCIGNLSKLEHLNITSCSKIQVLPESLCKLVILKHLNLSFCIKLEKLPSCIGELQLQSLNLQGTFLLTHLPDSIRSLSTLKSFEGEDSLVEDEVEELSRKMTSQASYELDVGSGDLWSQIVDLQKTPCHKLIMKRLEKVEHLKEAEQAKLSSNLKLTKLELFWKLDKGSLVENATTHKLVLEKLVPPRCLQRLVLDGYMCIEFPNWMLDIVSYLPHLTMIHLHNLNGCNHLPPLGRLPNLRGLCMHNMPNVKSIGREFYGPYGSCQKLRMIKVSSMDNLEEWWTTRSSNEDREFLIPNLHMLYASDCPKLKFVPYPPRSMCWFLGENSENVLPEHGFGNLSSTTSPFLLGIHMLLSSEGWRRAGYLSSLEHLVFDCIKDLPVDIKSFTSLRSLWIQDCDDLETLPEWLGGLTSLREILIEECPGLSSLPESMQLLTGLEKLRIVNCRALAEKCQGEDRHKIAHIPRIEYE
jgi:Leucine-rich repeat (LRR) protein